MNDSSKLNHSLLYQRPYELSSNIANGKDNRKSSEIPLHVFGQILSLKTQAKNHEKHISSDEEGSDGFELIHGDHSHHVFQKNPKLKIASKDWKVDTTQFNTSILDENRFTAAAAHSLQTSQGSGQLPFMTILLVILAAFVSGFKGTAFLLINLEECELDESGNIISCEQSGFVLRALWRQLLITIFFIPSVYKEYRQELKEEIDELRLYSRENLLNLAALFTIGFCSITYAIWVGTMAFSVFHTSMVNAYIFNNIYPLFFVIGKLAIIIFKRQQLSSSNSNLFHKQLASSTRMNKKEMFGGLLAVVVLFALAGENSSAIEAEMIALCGALAAALYQSNLQRIIFDFPWMLAVFLLSFFTTICFGFYTVIFEDSTLDMHRTHGVFGVFNTEWIFLHILISLLTGVVNVKLYSYISEKISTVYVDIAIMSEAFAPNFIESIIYIFYMIALILLALGKNDPQFEEITLLQDQSQQDEFVQQLEDFRDKLIIPQNYHETQTITSSSHISITSQTQQR